MNGIGNVASARFECSICHEDVHARDQSGDFALVKTSCPTRDVFHLKCITGWLDRQEVKLDERICICSEKALPLIRMNDKRQLEDESLYCETGIFNYCRNGNLPDLKALLDQDETLVNRDYHSVTSGHREHLLAVAIKEKQTDLVGLLIDLGADVNAAGHDGEPPLHIAARLRRTDDFNMLINAGADINKLLLFAIQKDETQLLDYVISTQPDPAKLNSALHDAVSQGQTQCLEPLVKMGANDLDGGLREAAGQGQTQCLKPLINVGAKDLNGALREAARWGETQCLELLLDEGAKDLFGALYLTVLTGNSEALEILTRKGIHVNEKLNNDWTAIHLAALTGDTKIVKELVSTSGINVNEKASGGLTALHVAALAGHTEIVKELVSSGEVNEKADGGLTALHMAALTGHTEIVKELVSTGEINVNEKANGGLTALHMAALKGHTETVKVLVSTRGINVNEKANGGVTALDLAWKYGFPECKKLLEDKGAVYSCKTACVIL